MDENDDVIIISSSKPRNCVSELYDCINVWNVHDHPKYGNMGCQSFKGGIQNLGIVLAKSQHTQKKFDFQSQFSI